MLRAERAHVGHPEQAHRALELGAQDLEHRVDPATAAEHEAVEVRPADEHAAGAHRERRRGVTAGAHPEST